MASLNSDEWTAQQERERKLRADLQAAEERAEAAGKRAGEMTRQRDDALVRNGDARTRIVTLEAARDEARARVELLETDKWRMGGRITELEDQVDDLVMPTDDQERWGVETWQERARQLERALDIALAAGQIHTNRIEQLEGALERIIAECPESYWPIEIAREALASTSQE